MASTTPNGERAVVLRPELAPNTEFYTSADALHFKHPGASPRELILHESITHLVVEVAELRDRCERLGETNEQLAKSLQALEEAYCDQDVRAPLTRANLTGYASSESSAYGDSGDVQANDDRFNAVALILEEYDQRLKAQAADQLKMERHMAELTAYKRASEVLFSTLRTKLEGLESADAVTSLGNSFYRQQMPISETNQDLIDLKARVADMERKTTSTDEARQAGLMTTTGGQGANMEQEIAQMKVILEKLNAFRKATNKKMKQQQIIDDASTKETLYGMYADIESISISDGERRRCGRFEGTEEELWPLKDRVICRIALVDRYAGAFEEVKTAMAKGLD